MNTSVAYFCAEYALGPYLPFYAGGLGVLAGDFLREAADQNFSIVGVGLYYSNHNPAKLDTVKDTEGKPLCIDIPIQDKKVWAQVFVYTLGSVPVYLLNTDVPENDLGDRHITDEVYVTDKETRLKQELVLGIGGFRALEALNIKPRIYHLNEGNSAFLALELVRQDMQDQGLSFSQAVISAKKRLVFTNHTLVAVGQEIYNNDLVALMFSDYAQKLGMPVEEIVKLGLIHESSMFSMTMFSLRLAEKINAVSKLHARKAADIWTNHPMLAITNGIHVATWDKVKKLDNHGQCKQELLTYIQEKTKVKWNPRDLLLGWARRFVEYKRPFAIFDDLNRFIKIAADARQPVRIVFSGKAHESDPRGQELVQELKNLVKEKLRDFVVYLPDYDMQVAQKMVAGCDVWLNTPIVGFEACGTSGMKAALNGVLPCTTRDGWVDEVNLDEIGWVLDNDRLPDHILDSLEKEVIPMYYQKPEEWRKMMEKARKMVLDKFTTKRMLQEYISQLYS